MADIPVISTGFAMIVDWQQFELAAVISSYIVTPGAYTPIFAFPSATAPKSDRPEDQEDEHAITRSRAPQFNVFAGNALLRMGGCNNLILAGLSDEQKSYLTFLKHHNVIEIPSLSEVDFFLGAFEDNPAYLPCRSAELINGLAIAVDGNLRLKVDEQAPSLENRPGKRDIIVVVENTSNDATIIGINYALSINADIKIVDPLLSGEEHDIKDKIEEWRAGSAVAYDRIAEKVNLRLSDIDFSSYQYATFFTNGLPYSLILKDIIPCTYVHALYRPDFFVFNALFYENHGRIGSAVVFSPQEFTDEETTEVIDAFEKENYYVRQLVGKDASAHNLDMHTKEFPYDFFHICSHGGEIGGYTIKGEFDDRDGNHHSYEFDQVVTFAPGPGEGMIPVFFKDIFRKFDGLTWKSPELKARPYPQHVFTDMKLAMKKAYDEKKEDRVPKSIITDSCAIKCSDFNYQAMFHVAAGQHTAPIIFNNSCWSWGAVSESFLVGGVRGYVGTLWDIGNDEAVEAARLFYWNLFKMPISDALQAARVATAATDSENIYIYWGLHFSTVRRCSSAEESRKRVMEYLLHAFHSWHDRPKMEKRLDILQNIKKLSDWVSSQLYRYFRKDYEQLRSQMMKK